jgi:hypothetical protein
MPEWVKRWFFEIIPPFILMSKPHMAMSRLKADSNASDLPLSSTNDSLQRLNRYLNKRSIEKYPPTIQQAIRDIRYISETQREAQQDDLVSTERWIIVI